MMDTTDTAMLERERCDEMMVVAMGGGVNVHCDEGLVDWKDESEDLTVSSVP